MKLKRVMVAILLTLLIASVSFAASVDELVKKGDKACKIGNYIAAKKFYKQAIQMDPKNNKLWKKYDKVMQMLYGGGDEEGGGGC